MKYTWKSTLQTTLGSSSERNPRRGWKDAWPYEAHTSRNSALVWSMPQETEVHLLKEQGHCHSKCLNSVYSVQAQHSTALILQSSQNKYLPSNATTLIIIRIIIFWSAASSCTCQSWSKVKELCVWSVWIMIFLRSLRLETNLEQFWRKFICCFLECTLNQVSQDTRIFLPWFHS